MANEQFAFLAKSDVPDRSGWQAAIDECGFDLTLDPELRPFEHAGFLPCKLLGHDSGFEVYYQTVSELHELSEVAGNRDYCVSFRWGGDMSECACVMIASYVLAKNFSASVFYEGEQPASLEELLAETTDVLRAAREDFDASRRPVPVHDKRARPWWKFW